MQPSIKSPSTSMAKLDGLGGGWKICTVVVVAAAGNQREKLDFHSAYRSAVNKFMIKKIESMTGIPSERRASMGMDGPRLYFLIESILPLTP